MKKTLQYLFEHQTLTREEARNALANISDGELTDSEISAFLTVFKMRGVTVEELTGFRDCLRERALHIDLSEYDCIDLCGSGGDGKDTFNISTLASFVIAGLGYKVAKHGNYGVSSVSGSSNVMEYFNYQFTNDSTVLKKQIDDVGITFLHAPLFHPAMKKVASVRRALGIGTFFNMLGPLVNPAFPRKQLVGVYSLQLQRLYKYIFEQEESSYQIVHSLDGYDEISLTDKAKIINSEKEYLLEPIELIGKRLSPTALYSGHSVSEAANIFLNVLNGKGSEAQNAAVCANAAIAIQCYEPDQSISDSYTQAQESLISGKALAKFKKLIS